MFRWLSISALRLVRQSTCRPVAGSRGRRFSRLARSAIPNLPDPSRDCYRRSVRQVHRLQPSPLAPAKTPLALLEPASYLRRNTPLPDPVAFLAPQSPPTRG